jgi:hypothetical protein
LRALEHGELPNPVTLIETQDVKIPVIAPNLEVAVVSAMPLIEVVHDLDLASIQAKSPGHFDAAVARLGLYPNLHGCALWVVTALEAIAFKFLERIAELCQALLQKVPERGRTDEIARDMLVAEAFRLPAGLLEGGKVTAA